MTYANPEALRTALEARIRNEAAESGRSPDRLRRRVVVQRLMTRLQRAGPDRRVVKGGIDPPSFDAAAARAAALWTQMFTTEES